MDKETITIDGVTYEVNKPDSYLNFDKKKTSSQSVKQTNNKKTSNNMHKNKHKNIPKLQVSKKEDWFLNNLKHSDFPIIRPIKEVKESSNDLKDHRIQAERVKQKGNWFTRIKAWFLNT